MSAYSIYDDKVLLTHLQSDDAAAFTEIYNRYWDRLFFVAHRRLKSFEDAQEIVQDVFFTLWKKRATLEIRELPLYLGAMTRYAVYHRLAAKVPVDPVEAARDGGGKLSVKELDIENRQFLDILFRLANQLPDKYRIVFVRHKLLDQPLEEVAAHLGVSVRTAEDYVTRVMKIMRENRRQLLSIFFF